MKIAITGSWRDEDRQARKLRDKAGFFTAVASVGAELVRLGHRLVIATDSPHTADRAAVDGALSELTRVGVYDQPVIDLLEGKHQAFAELAFQRPGFVNSTAAPPRAEVAKLYQVQLADAVLAFGGAEKTLQAVIAAATSRKRVVPVGCFGGAAAEAVKIFQALGNRWGSHIPPNDILGPLAMPWAPQSKQLVLRALGVRHPKLLVVHGRDLRSCDALVELLTNLGLPRPVVMAAEPDRGQSLPEKFEGVASGADAAIALITPDDTGGLKNGGDLQDRARQNVWVEVGWFWGALGRGRVLLLGKKGIEFPSDLSGLLPKYFNESPKECEPDICQWIESLGWPRPTEAGVEDPLIHSVSKGL